MERIKLPVERRVATGKGPNRRLRAAGRLPAVLYGSTSQPEKLSLDAHTFQLLLSQGHGENALFDIVYPGDKDGGDANVAVIREVQRDPLTRRPVHVDLYRIRMDVENDFNVAVRAHGSPHGVREGGILETHIYEVTVRCLPNNLPSAIDVDISGMGVNTALHVSDLPVPPGVRIMTDPETVVFTVLPPKKEAEVAAAAEGTAEPAQPEVIGKKKDEGEGGE
jgi:large subunit ribosomal protein L25